MGVQVIPEEAVDLEGVVAVHRVHRAEDVELHLVLLEQPDRGDHLVENRAAPPVSPIGVVQLAGSIQAQPDQKLLVVQELAPLVVQKDAVGLEGVLHRHAGRRVLLLQLHGPAEEVDTHERRLAALPGDGHLGNLVRLDGLPDVGLEHLVRHPEGATRIQPLLLQEEAVGAVQVAACAGGLGHGMKGAESHRLILPVLPPLLRGVLAPSVLRRASSSARMARNSS